MDLRSYLQTNPVLSEERLRDAVSNAAKTRRTLFEELIKNCGQYETDEATVLQWAEAAGEGEVRIVTTTKGLNTYLQGYRDLGGVETCLTAQILSVTDEDDTIVYIMMRPDDPALLHRIDLSLIHI